MIPIGDFNPRRHMPLVTVMLVIANAVVFLFQLTLSPDRLEAFILRAAVIPAAVAQNPGLSSLVPIITSMFVHGGWMHIIGNMLYLWIFGDNIEEALGAVGYLLFYLASGVVAALAQVAVSPQSEIPLVGASGAIAGVLGAYAVILPRNRVRTLLLLFYFIRVVEMPAIVVLGMWFLLQLLNGVASVSTVATGGVAWFAHLGGFALGVLVGFFMRPFRRYTYY